MKPIFVGSGVALITPFDKDGQIDFKQFKKNIEFQIRSATDAVIVCGTTGEGSTLSVDERLKLFTVAASQVGKRIPVIGGTGSNSTFFTLDLAKKAEECGIDAHLMVTPYYNKTSQNGLIQHYYKLADALTKPIIVYNVPSRTGMNITPETYFELSKHENIAAVKEADTNITKLQKAVMLCKDKLDFYIGNDDMISVSAAVGCKGVISVLSNILPNFTHKMACEGIKGNYKLSLDMQTEVLELIEAIFYDINPIPIKEAMAYFGLDTGRLRSPLVPMSESKRKELVTVLEKYKDYIMKENM